MIRPFKPPAGRHIGLLLKFAVSIGLMLWLFTRIDAGSLLSVLQQITPLTFGVALMLYVAAAAVGALKWHQLINGPDFRLLFRLMFVAQYYALLLPGQIAGEVVKAHKLNTHGQDPKTVISSIAFDRLTGWTALLMLGLTGLLTTQVREAAVLLNPFLWTIGMLGALLWLIRLELPVFELNNCIRTCPKMQRLYATSALFVSRATAVCRTYTRKPYLVLQNVGLGLVYHLIGAAIFYLFCRGFGIELGFLDMCWVFAAISLLLLLPVAVGGIGLRESGLVMLLGWLSVPSEKALAVSLCFFSLQMVGALIGAIFEWQPGKAKVPGNCPLPSAAPAPVAVQRDDRTS